MWTQTKMGRWRGNAEDAEECRLAAAWALPCEDDSAVGGGATVGDGANGIMIGIGSAGLWT